MKNKARVIAWYLPQFHPVKENDENWGKGFTEWTNVANAKPLWKGHHQPRIPADLGFYDLRMPEIRDAQAQMAREAGVEGFMYWHYWFNGKMLLEKPAEWVLESGKPDFPFCFGWANHEWSTSTWTKGVKERKKKVIAEMTYPGTPDNRAHFEYCLPFFKDKRYITVDGKPIFMIYAPADFVGIEQFVSEWNQWAKEKGLNGIYFVGLMTGNKVPKSYDEVKSYHMDGVCYNTRAQAVIAASGGYIKKRIKDILAKRFGMATHTYDYDIVMENMLVEDCKREDCFPIINPGYDCTARRGKDAIIYTNPAPDKFKKHVHRTVEFIQNKDNEHKIIFLQSWNEWGEGNYMEPDRKWGHAYLDALRDEIVEK